MAAVSLLHPLPRTAPPVSDAALPQPGGRPSALAADVARRISLSRARPGVLVERGPASHPAAACPSRRGLACARGGIEKVACSQRKLFGITTSWPIIVDSTRDAG